MTVTVTIILKHHSCETQLINTMEEITRHLDRNKKPQIDALILDFSKAFDTVAHQKLLFKIDHYGIKGNTATWIKSWLTNRTQRVVVDGETSEPTPVTSGVPQGTVLGPLMFLLYINDIGDNINNGTKIKLFADDCLLFRPISNPADQHQFQKDLDSLVNWSHQWQMSFNPQKCHTLHITRCKTPHQHNYRILGTDLLAVNNHPYLGVIISDNATWSTHINQITMQPQYGTHTMQTTSTNLSQCNGEQQGL